MASELEKAKGALDVAHAELALAESKSDERVAQALKSAKAEADAAHQSVEAANSAAERAKGSSAARIASLEQDLSSRSSENEALAAKLKADEAALRSAGDSGPRVQALTAELEQSKADLAYARSQLAAAVANSEKVRTEGTAGGNPDSERQIADLTSKLHDALSSFAEVEDENIQLKRRPTYHPVLAAPTAPQPVAVPAPAPAAETALASAPTPAPMPAQRTHVVVDGDTLTKISLEYYGSARRWQRIYDANRDKLPNESILSIGVTLVIP
jgi:nucleoid-associated protein YgaU